MQSKRQYRDPMSRTTSYQGIVLETPDFESDSPPLNLPWDEYGDWPWGRVGTAISLAISLGFLYQFVHESDNPLTLVFALLAANAAIVFWTSGEVRGPRAELGRIRRVINALLIHGSGVFVEVGWHTLPERSRELFLWALCAGLFASLISRMVFSCFIEPQRRAARRAILTESQFPRL
jgi:hypothetical protein